MLGNEEKIMVTAIAILRIKLRRTLRGSKAGMERRAEETQGDRVPYTIIPTAGTVPLLHL